MEIYKKDNIKNYAKILTEKDNKKSHWQTYIFYKICNYHSFKLLILIFYQYCFPF
jgi:hypothetical protein